MCRIINTSEAKGYFTKVVTFLESTFAVFRCDLKLQVGLQGLLVVGRKFLNFIYLSKKTIVGCGFIVADLKSERNWMVWDF